MIAARRRGLVPLLIGLAVAGACAEPEQEEAGQTPPDTASGAAAATRDPDAALLGPPPGDLVCTEAGTGAQTSGTTPLVLNPPQARRPSLARFVGGTTTQRTMMETTSTYPEVVIDPLDSATFPKVTLTATSDCTHERPLRVYRSDGNGSWIKLQAAPPDEDEELLERLDGATLVTAQEPEEEEEEAEAASTLRAPVRFALGTD